MSALLDILAAAFLLAGGVVIALAALGVARFPDPFTRMHAATKAGVVGCGLILIGTAFSLGTPGGWLTALAAVAFLVATTPIASHLLGRAAYVAGAPISPATISDALAGVLDRKLFDIDPARRPRDRRPAPPTPAPEEAPMTAVPIRDPARAGAQHQTTALRRLVCWLAGAGAQQEASAVAIALARDTGARLTGLSLLDSDAGQPRGAVPIGGTHWAQWLASSRRTRMRQAAAHAFAEFQDLARDAGVPAEARHDEGGLATLPTQVAAADLVIVPAGIDASGMAAPPAEELAAQVARARLVPVLRVGRRPATVRRVAILAGASPDCGRLAHGLIHGGLWATARVTVIPIGEQSERAAELARAQVDLLQAHGRTVELGDPLGADHSPAAAAAALRRYDAVVMATLSSGSGWFGAVRTDLHETAAETVALVLLP
ncbi:hypothetical protein STVA_13580 [Allostella vacuolata]|nr:hypothetical protein STVA_13580 [Stella vacuolata]